MVFGRLVLLGVVQRVLVFGVVGSESNIIISYKVLRKRNCAKKSKNKIFPTYLKGICELSLGLEFS